MALVAPALLPNDQELSRVAREILRSITETGEVDEALLLLLAALVLDSEPNRLAKQIKEGGCRQVSRAIELASLVLRSVRVNPVTSK